jgi:hypothetical protein
VSIEFNSARTPRARKYGNIIYLSTQCNIVVVLVLISLGTINGHSKNMNIKSNELRKFSKHAFVKYVPTIS